MPALRAVPPRAATPMNGGQPRALEGAWPAQAGRLFELLYRSAPPAAVHAVLAGLLATLVLLIARAHWVSFSGMADDYCVGEWLINYAGGFVRRGLGGAVILALTDAFGVRPRLAVFAVLAACYAATLLTLAVAVMRPPRVTVLDLLLVVSPFAALFPLLHAVAANRKEVLLFALAALAYGTDLGQLRSSARCIFWALVLAVLVAIHDGAIFFVPLFLFYLRALTPARYPLGWRLGLVALPALVVFIAGYLYAGQVDIGAICGAMARREPGRWCEPNARVQFTFAAAWLKATALDGARSAISRYTLLGIAETVLLGLLGLLPVVLALAREATQLREVLRSMPAPGVFVTLCVLALAALFVVGNDWNRWFYILTSLLTMLHFALYEREASGAHTTQLPGVKVGR